YVAGPWREPGVARYHAEPLLVLEYAFAKLFVAVIEQMHRADLVHPLLGRVMRRVRGAGRVFHEDRLRRIGLLDARHPVDGIVGQRGDEFPGARRLAQKRVDLRRVAEEVRLPLVRVTADEAVEILETHADRPLVERADLARGERGRVVVLAEP